MHPLSGDQLAPHKAAFDAMEDRMGFVPNSLKTLARKPRMLQMFMEFALETSKDDTLSIQLKYLAGLIASTVSGCTYCQAHLSVTAAKENITDEKIAAVWEFEFSKHYSEAERAALRFSRDAAQQPNQVTAVHYHHCYALSISLFYLTYSG
jgi:alkylhydroperoxidase family enzyme